MGTASRSLSTLFDSGMRADAADDVDANAGVDVLGEGEGDEDVCVRWGGGGGGGEETVDDDNGVGGDVNGEKGDPIWG